MCLRSIKTYVLSLTKSSGRDIKLDNMHVKVVGDEGRRLFAGFIIPTNEACITRQHNNINNP